MSKRVGIEMPAPLVEGAHYLAFDTADELRDVLNDSFRDRERADAIRAAGHTFAVQWHTTKARAIYVMRTLAALGLFDTDGLPAKAQPPPVNS